MKADLWKRFITLGKRFGVDKNELLFQYAKTFLLTMGYFGGKRKFNADKRKYTLLNKRSEFDVDKAKCMPFVYDWLNSAGSIDSYFFQDLWAAKKIYSSGVRKHFDIGSRIDGFILALLPFVNVTLMDIRPMDIDVEGLEFLQADATDLTNIEDCSIGSLSALCSLEHFGLGRFGDPIDPEACFKAFKAIQRVCAGKGRIYISVPVAEKDTLEFNAHRIFSPQTIVREFEDMELKEFCLANNDGYIKQVSINDFSGNGVGLFEFEKR